MLQVCFWQWWFLLVYIFYLVEKKSFIFFEGCLLDVVVGFRCSVENHSCGEEKIKALSAGRVDGGRGGNRWHFGSRISSSSRVSRWWSPVAWAKERSISQTQRLHCRRLCHCRQKSLLLTGEGTNLGQRHEGSCCKIQEKIFEVWKQVLIGSNILISVC